MVRRASRADQVARPADPAGGWFGSWSADAEGQPCFDLRVEPRPDLVLPTGGAPACWHQVANTRLCATAHAGGSTSIYSTARGMARLTGERGAWGVAGRPTSIHSVRWGLGYAEWTATAGAVELVRRVSIAPDDEPVLLIDVRLQWDGAHPFDYEERWTPEPWPLFIGGLMSPWLAPPPGFTRSERISWHALYAASALSRAATNAARSAWARRMVRPPQFDPATRALVTAPRRPVPPGPPVAPAWFDRSLPHLFVASVGDEPVSAAGDALRVAVGASPSGEGTSGVEARVVFAVGLADQPSDIARLARVVSDPATSPGGVDRRRRLTIELGSPPDRAAIVTDAGSLAREATWHAGYLVGARQYDAYFGRAYLSQGSAYSFVHGLQGAPRDYAIFSVPLAFLDPAGARQLLEVMLRMTRPSGGMHYAHTGRGQCTSGGLHSSPTDLPIFLLWALTEYVWATGDRAFLDEEVPFYPAAKGLRASPRARVLLAFRYLRERVGLGAHGMLRVGSGDWADPISAMVADRRAFHEHGESGFNTAFAVYALPRAAALIADRDPAAAAEMCSFADELRTAMERAWTGDWFLRGWDGRGGPVGDEHLFLDGQVWALIGGVGTETQRQRLIESITVRCDDPSPIGATILDRPHVVRGAMLAPGWDCNGGVWAAINGLLAWGYALHDPARAWRSLADQSLAAHAAAYPQVWYGIWSGPDAYNAHFGSRPGETFVQPATPMTEFPIMNANAHAGPLLGLLRTLGIETEPSGIVVRDRGPRSPAWTLASPLVSLAGGSRAGGAPLRP